MGLTEAYFQNILLPRAKAAAVCDALCRLHEAEGYERDTRRQLFDHRDFKTGPRAFVLSNADWCVVLHSDAREEPGKLRAAFASFPAVIDLWVYGKAWGYRLEEFGHPVTAYCSKAIPERPDEPPARQPGDLQRLVAACGMPDALPKLTKAEKGHFLFTEKACSLFAEALNVPVALFQFHDTDQANAGIIESRHAQGWTCQLLAFRRPPGAPIEPKQAPRPGAITPEQAAAVRQIQQKLKRYKWLRVIFTVIAGIVVGLLLTGFVAFAIVLNLLSGIPGLRSILKGHASNFSEDFWKELRRSYPKRIQLEGTIARNSRHSCTIEAAPPAKVLPKFIARKPIPGNEPVFDIRIDKTFVACSGRPKNTKITSGSKGVLEERSVPGGAFPTKFASQCHKHSKHEFYHYDWLVSAPRADYEFLCVREKPLSEYELQAIEAIVKSFRQDEVGEAVPAT